MINTGNETASLIRNTLSVALLRHARLLKAGLTPHEAQCAIITDAVELALDASTPREQENFGLFMQYQVEQFHKENAAFPDAIATNVISMSDYIARKDQQQAPAGLGSVTPIYADAELLYASN